MQTLPLSKRVHRLGPYFDKAIARRVAKDISEATGRTFKVVRAHFSDKVLMVESIN